MDSSANKTDEVFEVERNFEQEELQAYFNFREKLRERDFESNFVLNSEQLSRSYVVPLDQRDGLTSASFLENELNDIFKNLL